MRFLLVLFAVLFTVSSLEAVAAPYSFNVDRFITSGNITGNFIDEFNGGALGPQWSVVRGTTIESGGFLTLTNPGGIFTVTDTSSSGPDVIFESSQILSDGSPNVIAHDGSGNFTAEIVVQQTIPATDDFVALVFGIGTQVFVVSYANWSPELAAPDPSLAPGLSFTMHTLNGVVNIPGQLSVSSNQQQQVLTSAAAVTGNIHLRLSFNDATNVFTAAASQDGGASFFNIASSTVTIAPGWFGGFSISGDSRALVPPPVPGFGPFGIALVSFLLGTVGALMAFERRRGICSRQGQL